MLHDYVTNDATARPMSDTKSLSLQNNFLKLSAAESKRGKEESIRLGNEISGDQLDLWEGGKLKVQLVLLHNHRQNISERAIEACKNNLIAGLIGVDP